MKRWISMVICVCVLMSTVAVADVIDYSKYSNDELRTIIGEIGSELKNREGKGDAEEDKESEYEELTVGSKGDAVKKLQEQLYALGYLSGAIDGNYGNGTAGAVKAFQVAEDLEGTGIADSETQKKLFAKGSIDYSKYTEEELHTIVSEITRELRNRDGNGGATGGGNQELTVGSKGDAVKKLQEQLYALGYLSGSIDGSYGNGTANAVKAFQAAENLEETGIADVETQKKLFAKKAPKVIPIVVANAEIARPYGVDRLYVSFTNNSADTIDRVDFYAEFYDIYGRKVRQYNTYDYLNFFDDQLIAPGATTSLYGYYYILSGLDGASTVKIAINRYHTKSGKTVTIGYNDLIWKLFK